VKNISLEAPQYAVLSKFPQFLPSQFQIFSTASSQKQDLGLCSSLSVKDQVKHPYKTKHKIIVLYILISRFSERRQEDKGYTY
jgi:hypothetical protein